MTYLVQPNLISLTRYEILRLLLAQQEASLTEALIYRHRHIYLEANLIATAGSSLRPMASPALGF